MVHRLFKDLENDYEKTIEYFATFEKWETNYYELDYNAIVLIINSILRHMTPHLKANVPGTETSLSINMLNKPLPKTLGGTGEVEQYIVTKELPSIRISTTKPVLTYNEKDGICFYDLSFNFYARGKLFAKARYQIFQSSTF